MHLLQMTFMYSPKNTYTVENKFKTTPWEEKIKKNHLNKYKNVFEKAVHIFCIMTNIALIKTLENYWKENDI